MTKINRNSPCPCGSGKKYKKCCAGKQNAIINGNSSISTELTESIIDDVKKELNINNIEDQISTDAVEAMIETAQNEQENK